MGRPQKVNFRLGIWRLWCLWSSCATATWGTSSTSRTRLALPAKLHSRAGFNKLTLNAKVAFFVNRAADLRRKTFLADALGCRFFATELRFAFGGVTFALLFVAFHKCFGIRISRSSQTNAKLAGGTRHLGKRVKHGKTLVVRHGNAQTTQESIIVGRLVYAASFLRPLPCGNFRWHFRLCFLLFPKIRGNSVWPRTCGTRPSNASLNGCNGFAQNTAYFRVRYINWIVRRNT